MSVLVTGAGGFLGSRLARLLAQRGERVRAMVRHGASASALAGLDLEIVRGDVRFPDEMYRALAGCTRLYHVAAVYSFAVSRDKMLAEAIEGADAVAGAALKRGLERVVWTSSVATIGSNGEPVPMDESHAWSPEIDGAIAYVEAKKRSEQRALDWAARGLPVVVVCPSGIYGPGDWKPTPSGAMVVRMLRSGIPAWTEGGLSIADVDDIAEGHVGAMEKGRLGERYILGGENLTTRAILELLADLCGRPHPRFKATRGAATLTGWAMEAWSKVTGREPEMTRDVAAGVGRYYWVTSGKAEVALGYRHRPARETLARAVRWYVEQGYTTRGAAA